MSQSVPQRALLFILMSMLPLGNVALAQSREDARLITATQVLEELRATPDQNIPAWLFDRAYGVAVIPDVLKGAFVFGGRHGNGALVVRDSAGRFSNPVFISLTGGSVGWQIGAQAADIVLIFASRKSVDKFASGDFTLGLSASVAAGPVGRSGEAAAGVTSEIYSYSRARGLFAGVALDGTALVFDRSANHKFYGHDVTTDDILGGTSPPMPNRPGALSLPSSPACRRRRRPVPAAALPPARRRWRRRHRRPRRHPRLRRLPPPARRVSRSPIQNPAANRTR